MKHLFYLCGKSASGKDTIYEELLKDESLQLRPLVPYTTRPIRAGEMEGQEYHFTDRETLRRLEKAGRVIEERTYETVCGLWTYFTSNGSVVDGKSGSYIFTRQVNPPRDLNVVVHLVAIFLFF